MSEEGKITLDMTISEILRLKPKASRILSENGMHCLGCVIAQGETLRQAADVHGLDSKDLLKRIGDL